MAVAYMLRTMDDDLCGYEGFQWRNDGEWTIAPDWDPAPVCGGGLHGFLWGEGNGSLANWEPDAIWAVVQIDTDGMVVLDNGQKVKVPTGLVIHTGTQKSATDKILALRADAGIDGIPVVIGARVIVGHGGTATVGDSGTAIAGYRGTAIAEDGGILLIKWWDSSASRYRIATGYVGEAGILPNTKYRCSDSGMMEKVE